MTKPFELNDRTYTFTRTGSEYTITRDDGLMAWDVYPVLLSVANMAYGKTNYHGYRPAFATIDECKQAIRGERPSTFYHRLVFAASATEAAKIAEEEDHAKGS